jgi:hypothetical protein
MTRRSGIVFSTRAVSFWSPSINLARAYDRDRDEACVASFVDNLLGPDVEEQSWEEVRRSILFALEPSDYADPPPLRTPISTGSIGRW